MSIPTSWWHQMRKMGLFGLNVPEEYGGAGVDYATFAMVFEELSRGWLGLAGVLGTHSVLCDVLIRFGTAEQKQRYLPGLASGERRGGICLSRAQRGHRSAKHQHRGRTTWRWLSDQWFQNVDHERSPR